MDTALAWVGSIDFDSAERLTTGLDDHLRTLADDAPLVIDLSGVTFVDPSGLGVLMSARDRCELVRRQLLLRCASVPVRRQLAITGLTKLFSYEDPDDEPTGRRPGALPARTVLPATPDARFDRLAALAARLLDAPRVMVNLVDEHRQVVPGAAGLTGTAQQRRQMPLAQSVCRFVVLRGEALAIPDVRADPTMQAELELEDPGVVAYAGSPLVDSDGRVLGSLCAIHPDPHEWNARELADLDDLAGICSAELQTRTAAARAALHGERHRLARDLQGRVTQQLLAIGLLLSEAQELTAGTPAQRIGEALDRTAAALDHLQTIAGEPTADPGRLEV